MARLPIVGEDNGNWGTILNNFLKTSHSNDGSLKPIPQSKITNLTDDLADLQSDVTAVQSDVSVKADQTDLDDEVDARIAGDTASLNRSNHTGTQAISTVTGLQTVLDEKLEQATADGLYAKSTSFSPVVTVSVGDFVLANTGAAWADLDAVSAAPGTAAARPMDLVIPNVAAGDWVTVSATGIYNNGGGSGLFTLFTVVAGTPVRAFGDPAAGVAAWAMLSSLYSTIAGSVSLQLQADDIEGGAVRIRPRYYKNTANTKTLFGSTIGYRLRLEGTGPF